VICCEFINQDRGRSNTAFEQEEDDGRLSSSTPVRNPPKARQRQQVRDPSANHEFNNAAFEQDDDQQSITPPPPYPSEPITADGQVHSHNEQKKTREKYHIISSINSFEDIAKNVKCCCCEIRCRQWRWRMPRPPKEKRGAVRWNSCCHASPCPSA
jgi:hypothetical protein